MPGRNRPFAGPLPLEAVDGVSGFQQIGDGRGVFRVGVEREPRVFHRFRTVSESFFALAQALQEVGNLSFPSDHGTERRGVLMVGVPTSFGIPVCFEMELDGLAEVPFGGSRIASPGLQTGDLSRNDPGVLTVSCRLQIQLQGVAILFYRFRQISGAVQRRAERLARRDERTFVGGTFGIGLVDRVEEAQRTPRSGEGCGVFIERSEEAGERTIAVGQVPPLAERRHFCRIEFVEDGACAA